MKKITLILAAFFAICYTHAQTTLTAGDIAFVGSGVDAGGPFTDYVAFVLLKDIDAATTIIFTDRGWSDTTGFGSSSGDGDLTWVSGSNRSAGDIITINLSSGQLSGGGAYAIQGDQMFAIQGSIASPTFIAGLHFNVEPLGATGASVTTNDANWDGNNLNNDESALPNALITGDTAVRLFGANGAEQDNFQFSCTLAGSNPISGTPAQIRAILHNASNWNVNNSAGFNPAIESGCTISIMAAADTTPPVITCAATPANIIAAVNGTATVPDLVSGSSATDDVSASGDITITQSPTIGTVVGVGVTMVTVTATDEAGNSASCMIDVTVVEPPSTVLEAGDIAFVGYNSDGGDTFSIVLLKDIIAGTNIKFTDCGVNNPNTINCLAGDGTNTWFATTPFSAGTVLNFSGLNFLPGPVASTGDQIFAYQGTSASPTFIAGIHANIEPGTNDTDWDGATNNNDESALPNQLINGVNAIRVHSSETEIDNWQFDCSLLPAGVTLDGSAANIAAIVNNLDYWISNDSAAFNPAANASCVFNVVVSSDTTDPVISDCGPTPAVITADVLGNATVPDLTGNVVATDDTTAVGDLVIVQSPAAGTTITAGVTTVTLFVTDEAGNTATCTIDITVENIVATTLATGDIAFVAINQDGNDSFAFILLRDILAGTMISFTDCGVTNPNSITCNGSADTTDTWFSPTNMSAGSIVTLSNFLNLGNIGDQIFAYQGPANNPTFLAGVHTSVVTATNDTDWDGANTSGATTALPDQLTNGVNAIRLHNLETEADNWQFDCTAVPGGLPISGTPEEIAAIINDLQYWIFNDTTPFDPAARAGCTYTIILDNVPPTITCPTVSAAALDVNCQNALPDYTSFPTVTDNVDPNPVVTQDPAPGTIHSGPIDVTLTATDASGNSASCTFTLQVIDAIPPTAVCQDITVQLDASGNATITGADVDGGSTDNCGIAGLSVSPNTFDVSNVGSNMVTLTVTDNDNNTATCTANVTVEDNVPPEAICINDFTLQIDLDANGEASITAADIDNGSNDASGIASLSVSPNTFECIDVGQVFVTLTVTDNNGNVSNCSTNIVVNDPIAPVVTCPGDIMTMSSNGNPVVIDPGQPTVTDNCDTNINLTFQRSDNAPNVDDPFPVGVTTIMWTATDLTNNMGMCTQTVTVNFNPPVSVPNVVDLPQATAESNIVGANLTVGAVTTANSNTIAAGNVISQNPMGGSSVAPGSAVDLVISLGPSCMVMIDTQPMDVTVSEGATNVDFMVTASGTGTLSYNWEFSSDGGTTFFDVNPAVDGNPTFTLGGPLGLAANGNQYRVVVTSDNGTPGDTNDDCEVTSDAATLTVDAVPCMVMIDTQPMDIAVCDGAFNIDFTVVASGTGTLSYNWEFSADGGTTFFDVNPSSDGNPTFTLGGPLGLAANGNQYRVVVTSDNGTPGNPSDDCEVTSDAATLTVNPNPMPVITGSNSYPFGGTGVTLDAGAGFASYLWSPGGQTTQTINNALAGSYQVTVINANGCEGISAEFVVTEDPPTVLSVTSFILVDADTDTELFTITNGMFIDVATLPTLNLDIRAITTSDVESVMLSISGALNSSRTESLMPYALFQDLPIGDYMGATFVLGDYTVSGTPFSLDAGNGTVGTPLSVDFTIGNNPACTSFDAFVDSEEDPTTCGGSDGSIIIGVVGENPPVSYELMPGGTVNTTGTFTGLSAGNYTINVLDDSGCTETLMVTLMDPPLPMVTLAPFISVLDTDSAFMLTGGSPMGGTYSGTGVSGGMFDPQVVGAGTYDITYSYTDPVTNCMNSAVQPITVIDTNVLSVTSFILVDADTDTELFPITNGMFIDVATLPTLNLDIRAITTPDVESVMLSISGALTSSRTESLMPYALFQDLPIGDYMGATFVLGDYTVSGTPFSLDAGNGTMGTPLSVDFTIGDNPACTDFDASVDDSTNPTTCGGADGSIIIMVQNFNNPVGYTLNGGPAMGGGGIINITGLSAGTYTIEVFDDSNCMEILMETLNDPPLPVVTLAPFINVLDTDSAFMLTGGSPMGGTYSGTGVSGGMFDPQAVGAGTYDITYSYTDPITNCINSAVQPITVIDTNVLSVTSFTLIDAATDQPLFDITPGQTIVFGVDINTLFLDIRANTTSDVESVTLSLTGQQTSGRTESLVPYALFRDLPIGDYIGNNFEFGAYTVSATPFSLNNGSGTTGTPLSVDFSIVMPPPAVPTNSLSIYPNPANIDATASFEEPAGATEIMIFDMLGRLVKTYPAEAIREGNDYRLNVYDLPIGTYFIRTADDKGFNYQKQMIIKR